MGVEQLNASINSLIMLVRNIAIVCAAFMFCVGGWQYMTAGGNPSSQQAAKSTMWNATIGLGIIMASSVIANVLGSILRF
jgi:TRAP-type C4-dicarboxylate transport system permease small subunit